MIRRHPSRRRLVAWWNSEDEGGPIAEHVERCELCAGRIEALVPGEPSPPQIGQLLGELLSPDENLSDRLRSGISERMRDEADMRLVAELLGTGMRTARLLVFDELADEHDTEEAT